MIKKIENPETEIDEFIELGGKSFFNEGNLPGGFDIEVFKRNWTNLIKAKIGIIWLLYVKEKVGGALGVVVSPDLNDGELVMTEAFWYVLPEYRGTLQGVRLFREMELDAFDMGVKRILMIHYHSTMDGKLPKFYEKNGYKAVETHYVKVL